MDLPVGDVFGSKHLKGQLDPPVVDVFWIKGGQLDLPVGDSHVFGSV